MNQITIGIPRSLLYFRYRYLWETFFQELNCKIILSPPTNKEILNDGLVLSIDENCLPVKVYLGHIKYLQNKADYIFVPRIVTLHKNEQSCNKFMALYDNVASIFHNIPLLEYTVDVRSGESEFMGFFKMGLRINRNPLRVIRAYLKATNVYQETKNQLICDQEAKLKFNKNDLTILIVSHPYVIHDLFIGKPITKFLEKESIMILYSDIINQAEAKKRSKNISTDLYWTENMEFIGSIDYYKKKIDGIIYVTSFPCGPDALVVDLCQKKVTNIPSMVLILDELQSEIGMLTRLESFIDILRIKKARNAKEKN